jgi:hypothetical protein
MMNQPRNLTQRFEKNPQLPKGDGEILSVYGASSRARSPRAMSYVAGTSWLHRSVRHTPPFGIVIRTATDASIKMFRLGKGVRAFFGKALADVTVLPIETHWDGPRRLRIVAPGRIEWQFDLNSTLATRAMNLMGSVMPDALWKNPTVLAAMAPVAGVALGAGKLRLTGRAPNGQRLIANPLLTWTVPSAKATIAGRNLGAVVPLRKQSKLGDF